MHRWLVSFAIVSFAIGCSSGGNNSGGFGTGGGSNPGCTSEPNCNSCNGCYELCVCTTGNLAQCKPACGISGTGGSGGSGATGGIGGDSGAGGNGGTTTTGSLAAGLRITEIAVYQAVKVSIMQQGAAVSSPNAPVVAGKDALVRVFVTPDPGYQPRDIVARLEITGSAAQEVTKTISAPSNDSSLESAFNFNLPGAALAPNVAYSVSLLEAQSGAPSGATDGARFPAQGEISIGAQSSNGPIKIVLVPLISNGFTPDTNPTKMEYLRKRVRTLYPVPEVEFTMHSAVTTSSVSGNGTGFDTALNTMINVRQNDYPAFNVYYYGMLAPSQSAEQFCGYGCVAGLSMQAQPGDDWSRVSVGLAYFPDGSSLDATNTMAHEVGHANGLPHAPCQTPDPGPYPYAGGVIGVWGFDTTNQKLLDPSSYKDMMGYCQPDWISDFNYQRIFTRLVYVNSSAYVIPNPDPQRAPGTFRSATLGVDGKLRWGATLEIKVAQSGELKQVELRDASGKVVQTVVGFYYPFDHLGGGLLLVRESLFAVKPGVTALASSGLGTLELAH